MKHRLTLNLDFDDQSNEIIDVDTGNKFSVSRGFTKDDSTWFLNQKLKTFKHQLAVENKLEPRKRNKNTASNFYHKYAHNPTEKYVATDKELLQKVIKYAIKKEGPEANLNFIDVSHMKDFRWLFAYDLNLSTPINPDISEWDVSNATDLSDMFLYCKKFNPDVSKWDVSKVTDMSGIFSKSAFNGDISNWNVSNVTNMNSMFADSMFDRDISNWDVSNVNDMGRMFNKSKFNGDISNWDVSNVKNMNWMFMGSAFNGDLSKWDISNVKNTDSIFEGSAIDEQNRPQGSLKERRLSAAENAYKSKLTERQQLSRDIKNIINR